MKTILLCTALCCGLAFGAESAADRDVILGRIVKCEDAVIDAKAKGDRVGADVFTQQANGLKKKSNVTEKEIVAYRVRLAQPKTDDVPVPNEADVIADKTKIAIPSEQEKAESLKFIKDFYKDWYVGQPDKRAASTVLLGAAKKLNAERNALRYVMLTESINFGVIGGNLRSGHASLKILREWGRRDCFSEEYKFFQALNANFPGGGDNWTPNDLMQCELDLASECHDANRADLELSLYKLLEAQAKNRQNLDLLLKVQENIKELEKPRAKPESKAKPKAEPESKIEKRESDKETRDRESRERGYAEMTPEKALYIAGQIWVNMEDAKAMLNAPLVRKDESQRKYQEDNLREATAAYSQIKAHFGFTDAQIAAHRKENGPRTRAEGDQK